MASAESVVLAVGNVPSSNMSNELLPKIRSEMERCMRSRDASRLATIRMLLAAIKQREIDERIVLDDGKVIAVVEKMIKQRRESMEQFQKAKRQDLFDKEEAEVAILMSFMPEPLTDEELKVAIDEAVAVTGVNSIKDMSKVVNEIRVKVQGREDMGKVSQEIKKILDGK